jgi:virginiamycin B lyase
MQGFDHRSLTVAAGLTVLALGGCSGSQTMPEGAAITAARHSVAPARARFVEFTNGISPNASPGGIITSSTQTWFTEPGVDKIAKISSSGVVKEYPVTPGSAPNNVAFGSDGNLWYTEATDAIGRMTPRGRVTNFPIGSAPYGPWDIALGADGNMWFSVRSPSGSSYYDAIGRITPSGTVTLFPIPPSEGDVAVHDMALGPDGNIWFTEEFANRVAKITTGGVITEYSSGIQPNATPVDVAAGADGNVWFTEYSVGNVARITPSGTVTEFSVGYGTSPAAIASGGNYVWICEDGTNQLGRVNMSGTVNSYTLPGQSCFQDAARGVDMWITDQTGNGMIKGSGLGL